MFERVLVPLDGSALSERALEYGAAQADRFGARLTLLRAFDGPRRSVTLLASSPTGVPPTGMTTPHMVEAVAEAAAETEAEIRAYLGAHQRDLHGRGLNVDTLAVDGEPAAAILEEAEREPDTIVVMSTQGRGGLGRLIFGSTAQDVLRRSRVPLLLIRAPEDTAEPDEAARGT